MIDHMKYPSRLLFVASLVAGYALTAKDVPPVMYPFSEMRRIAVLPVVDSRGDKKEKIDVRRIQATSMKILSDRRYQPVASDQGVSALDGLTEDDLKKASPGLINRLGPESERWVLVVCFSDATSKVALGRSETAQVFGFLFDKERGKVAWSDTGTGHVVEGGVNGMITGTIFKSRMKSGARYEAVSVMLQAFPKLPKVRK
jgi:hypothetical protein